MKPIGRDTMIENYMCVYGLTFSLVHKYTVFSLWLYDLNGPCNERSFDFKRDDAWTDLIWSVSGRQSYGKLSQFFKSYGD